MKKVFVKAMFAGALLTCNFTAVSAQNNVLGNILSSVANGSSASGNTTSNIISGLTTIFSNSKVATADKIVGTWVYEEPAVVFESSNLLKKAGGSMVSSRIEKRLQTILNKYGITKGNFKMTFDKNGNFTQTIRKKTIKGTYTIDGKNVKLQYAGGMKQVLGTTQLEGNSLLIVMDATKLLKFAGAVGSVSGNSLLKTAGSLLSGMDGMECGVRLKKTK